MKLFLDDNRNPYDVFKKTIDPLYEENKSWQVVRDYYQFINFIQRYGIPNVVSLDHDLSQEHYLNENQTDINYEAMKIPTGYHAAKWLIEYCKENNKKLPEIKVHSENLEGKMNIERLFFENKGF